MKGKKVGKNTGLLWPDATVMAEFSAAPEPTTNKDLIIADTSFSDLLWPAHLINEQARQSRHKTYSLPFAIIAFILSLIANFAIGPVQLALIVTTLDYNWVGATYLPIAAHFCLLLSSLIALICIISLALSYRSTPKSAALAIALTLGTLAELSLLWFSSCLHPLESHEFTLIYAILTVSFLFAAIFINKHYFENHHLSSIYKIIISALIILSIIVASFTVTYLVDYSEQTDPARLASMQADQAAARLEDVPAQLSDFTHQLCSGKYSIIHLADPPTSGLFECHNSHDIYSVEDLAERNLNSLRAAATYLGTTMNPEVSQAFPEARYLYRAIPGVLDEIELALMTPAINEEELLNSITPHVLSYWQTHNSENLHLSIFYTDDITSISTTKDFILMSALDTMSLVDKLPSGNVRHGYHDGKILAYLYQPDRSLIALNQLGANPTLYATSSRNALTTHRHISLHLKAGETLDEETLYAKLSESFTGGLQ